MAEAGDYLEPEINFPIDFDLVDDMMDPHPPPLTPKQLKRLRRRLHLPKVGPMAKEESGGTVDPSFRQPCPPPHVDEGHQWVGETWQECSLCGAKRSDAMRRRSRLGRHDA